MQQFWRLFLFGFGLFEASLLVQLFQLFLLTVLSSAHALGWLPGPRPRNG